MFRWGGHNASGHGAMRNFLIGETRGGVADVAIEWWSDG